MTNNSVCVNHPNRDAYLRCNQCWKPLCQECVIKTDYGVYCSHSCAEKGKLFKQQLEAQPKRSKRDIFLKKIFKILFSITILLILLYVLYLFGPSPISEWLGIIFK